MPDEVFYVLEDEQSAEVVAETPGAVTTATGSGIGGVRRRQPLRRPQRRAYPDTPTPAVLLRIQTDVPESLSFPILDADGASLDTFSGRAYAAKVLRPTASALRESSDCYFACGKPGLPADLPALTWENVLANGDLVLGYARLGTFGTPAKPLYAGVPLWFPATKIQMAADNSALNYWSGGSEEMGHQATPCVEPAP